MSRSLADELEERLARMQQIAAEEDARQRRLYNTKRKLQERKARADALAAKARGAVDAEVQRVKDHFVELGSELTAIGAKAAGVGRMTADLGGRMKAAAIRLRPSRQKRPKVEPTLQHPTVPRSAPAGAPAYRTVQPERRDPRFGSAFPKETRFPPDQAKSEADRLWLRGDPSRDAVKAVGGKPAFTAQPPESSRTRRTDLTIAAIGVTLGLTCAIFPWYIFFNPEEFGVRGIRFLGNGDYVMTGPMPIVPQPDRVGAPSDAPEIPIEKLDLFATGTTAPTDETETDGAALASQPFPAAPAEFKIVHMANGRAMLQDDGGIFVVQKGSILPDNSFVASIEQRKGRWVLVTSADKVLELSE